jgi:hypothetical protein
VFVLIASAVSVTRLPGQCRLTPCPFILVVTDAIVVTDMCEMPATVTGRMSEMRRWHCDQILLRSQMTRWAIKTGLMLRSKNPCKVGKTNRYWVQGSSRARRR